MFTGIIQSLGEIQGIESKGKDACFSIGLGKLPVEEIKIGDSIAVNGVCLTVVRLSGNTFFADVSNETLSCTTLKELRCATRVNLELALTPTTRLGGHLVSGHVDGVGAILVRREDQRSVRFKISMPKSLARYIAAKGSICVDGISLTVNQVQPDAFEVNIVPHTLAETNLGTAVVGRRVNLEVDLIARYLERLLAARDQSSDQIDLETLEKAGFF